MMYQKLSVISKLHHIIIDKIKLMLLFKALTLVYHKDRHFFRIFFLHKYAPNSLTKSLKLYQS